MIFIISLKHQVFLLCFFKNCFLSSLSSGLIVQFYYIFNGFVKKINNKKTTLFTQSGFNLYKMLNNFQRDNLFYHLVATFYEVC